MQNKHTDRALLESKEVQQILTAVIFRNNVTGADIAPWSNGELQDYDKAPAPRAIATHVAINTVKALKEQSFNDAWKEKLESGKDIADAAFKLEKHARGKGIKPEGYSTVSEQFIRAAVQERPLGSKLDDIAKTIVRTHEIDMDMGKMAEAAHAATSGLRDSLKAKPHKSRKAGNPPAVAKDSANEANYSVADLVTPDFGKFRGR